MKKLILILSLFVATVVIAADVKISELPLGSAPATSTNDSFPYVDSVLSTTKRLKLSDIANLPSLVSTFAKTNNPVFTGTVTGTFSGPLTGNVLGNLTGDVTGNVTGDVTGDLTGNASTASAFFTNPTGCPIGEYAQDIGANGDLTCSQVDISGTSGVLEIAQGGTNSSTALSNNKAMVSSGGAIVESSVTDTELGHLSGVTSGIQSQINAKAPLASPTFTGTVTTPVTASRALVSGASSELAASSVTDTELGYLSGTTSSVQTQINSKAASSALTAHTGASSGVHGITGAVVGTTDAQVITAKDIDGGTASNTSRVTVPKNTKSNLDALTRKEATLVYATDSQKLFFDDGSALKAVGSGSGSGSVNYILNPDAEIDTAGYSTYADAAGTAPVDGTGGTANVTWTRTTSSPLAGAGSFLLTKDAVNRQGQGVSYDFTINNEDKAKKLAINFSYEVTSGTYADNDVTFWIYDVTNGGAPIQPDAYQLLNVIGPQKKQTMTFQTASNSTSYRLIAHISSASASAYSLKFDSFSVGPQIIPNGPIAGYLGQLPTTGAWSTNTTYVGQYWRTAHGTLKAEVTVNLSGAPNSAQLTVNLPSGLSIDTDRMSEGSQLIGIGQDVDSGVGRFQTQVIYETPTTVGLYYGSDTGSGALRLVSGGITQAAPQTFAAGDRVSFRYEVPILGWSSNVVVSNSAETRAVAAKYSLTSDETTAANADHIMTNFTTKVYDTHGAMSGSRFTAPVPGFYKVRLKALTNNHSWTTSDIPSAYLAKNGSSQSEFLARQRVQAAFTDRIMLFGETSVELKAGEYVELNIRNATSGTVPVIFAGLSFFEVEMIQGPAQIAASNVIAAKRYSSSTALVYNTTTAIAWTNSEYDTHGGFGSSSVYTVQAPGKYAITARYNGASQSASGAERFLVLAIRVNGVIKAYGSPDRAYSTTGREYVDIVHATVPCVTGDTIDVVGFTNLVTSVNTSNNGGGMAENFITIERIGGLN